MDALFIEDLHQFNVIKAQADQVTKLKFEKSDVLDDWYLIVRDLPTGLKACTNIPTDYGYRFALTDRVATACVEGHLSEMREIAQAILDKRNVSPGRRCSVVYQAESEHANPQLNTDESVRFMSPRNCEEYGPQFPYEDAVALANEVLAYIP
jgi:hypothetical protein